MPSEPCERTNDCPTPRVCNVRALRDTTPRTVDTDCELGSICNMPRGRCVLGCRNRQRPDELVCDNYQCVDGQRCTSDRECAPRRVFDRSVSWSLCRKRSPGFADAVLCLTVGFGRVMKRLRSTLTVRTESSSLCEPTDCVSAYGGSCGNCDCQGGLVKITAALALSVLAVSNVMPLPGACRRDSAGTASI